jgi:hypothetical protein
MTWVPKQFLSFTTCLNKAGNFIKIRPVILIYRIEIIISNGATIGTKWFAVYKMLKSCLGHVSTAATLLYMLQKHVKRKGAGQEIRRLMIWEQWVECSTGACLQCYSLKFPQDMLNTWLYLKGLRHYSSHHKYYLPPKDIDWIIKYKQKCFSWIIWNIEVKRGQERKGYFVQLLTCLLLRGK